MLIKAKIQKLGLLLSSTEGWEKSDLLGVLSKIPEGAQSKKDNNPQNLFCMLSEFSTWTSSEVRQV